MAEQQQVLVIKHGALGDVVQGFDAYASLRAGLPNAHIAVLTSPAFAKFMQMMPWFDEVLVDPRPSLLNLPAMLRVRALLRRGWDMIIDLQCSGRTARYHRFFVPRQVRWFGTAEGASDAYPDFTAINNYHRMLTAAKIVGGRILPLESVDLSWLDKGSAVPIDGATVLIPGCSIAKPNKRWPVQNFAELAMVLQESGQVVIIVGTEADRPVADELLLAAPQCHDLVGKTDLAGLARVLQSADLVVGNDTGPLFLAARLGARSIMVMGPDTDPAMSAPTGACCSWVRADPISSITTRQVLKTAAELAGG